MLYNLGGKQKETERQKESGKERRKQNKEEMKRKTEVKGLCAALLCKVSVYIQSV